MTNTGKMIKMGHKVEKWLWRKKKSVRKPTRQSQEYKKEYLGTETEAKLHDKYGQCAEKMWKKADRVLH